MAILRNWFRFSCYQDLTLIALGAIGLSMALMYLALKLRVATAQVQTTLAMPIPAIHSAISLMIIKMNA